MLLSPFWGVRLGDALAAGRAEIAGVTMAGAAVPSSRVLGSEGAHLVDSHVGAQLDRALQGHADRVRRLLLEGLRRHTGRLVGTPLGCRQAAHKEHWDD